MTRRRLLAALTAVLLWTSPGAAQARRAPAADVERYQVMAYQALVP